MHTLIVVKLPNAEARYYARLILYEITRDYKVTDEKIISDKLIVLDKEFISKNKIKLSKHGVFSVCNNCNDADQNMFFLVISLVINKKSTKFDNFVKGTLSSLSNLEGRIAFSSSSGEADEALKSLEGLPSTTYYKLFGDAYLG